MVTKAQQRFQQEQTLRRLLAEDGIRYVGVYGAPYPTNRNVTRYHIVGAVETHETYSYVDIVITPEVVAEFPKYAEHLGKKAKQTIKATTTYAETACNLGYSLTIGTTHPNDQLDIVEMTERNGERATDAPVCARCAKIAGV